MVQDHVDDLGVLAPDRKIDGVAVLLRLHLDVQCLGVELQEVLCDFVVAVLECHHQGRGILCVQLIDVDDWLAIFILVCRVEIDQVSEQHKLVIFYQLVQYRPIFWAVFQAF